MERGSKNSLIQTNGSVLIFRIVMLLLAGLIIVGILSLMGLISSNTPNDWFIPVRENHGTGLYVVYDRVTHVMYATDDKHGILNPLYNTDGSLRVYEGISDIHYYGEEKNTSTP